MTHTEPSRLLVIEDDLGLQRALSRQLEHEGYHVHQAGDGVEGLDRTRELRPDLVLCDWIMPRLDGIEYCRTIKGDPDLRGTYVALLTARAESNDMVIGLDSGADDFLVKPVAPNELLARVRAGLRIRRLQHELAEAGHREALLEIAATMGHEINNPLTALFGHLELLLQYLKNGEAERMQHHIRQAGQVGNRIADVARQLITIQDPRTRRYLDEVKMLDLEDR